MLAVVSPFGGSFAHPECHQTPCHQVLGHQVLGHEWRTGARPGSGERTPAPERRNFKRWHRYARPTTSTHLFHPDRLLDPLPLSTAVH